MKVRLILRTKFSRQEKLRLVILHGFPYCMKHDLCDFDHHTRDHLLRRVRSERCLNQRRSREVLGSHMSSGIRLSREYNDVTPGSSETPGRSWLSFALPSCGSIKAHAWQSQSCSCQGSADDGKCFLHHLLCSYKCQSLDVDFAAVVESTRSAWK